MRVGKDWWRRATNRYARGGMCAADERYALKYSDG